MSEKDRTKTPWQRRIQARIRNYKLHAIAQTLCNATTQPRQRNCLPAYRSECPSPSFSTDTKYEDERTHQSHHARFRNWPEEKVKEGNLASLLARKSLKTEKYLRLEAGTMTSSCKLEHFSSSWCKKFTRQAVLTEHFITSCHRVRVNCE